MDIADWLRRLGLDRYEQVFRENRVESDVLPNLTAELCRRGFSEAELRMIFHENYHRVFKEVLG